MLVQRRAIHIHQTPKATLYALVFETKAVKIASYLMFSFMLVQPIAPLFASTEAGVFPEVVPENVGESEDSLVETYGEITEPVSAPLIIKEESTLQDKEETEMHAQTESTTSTQEEGYVPSNSTGENTIILGETNNDTTTEIEDVVPEAPTDTTGSATTSEEAEKTTPQNETIEIPDSQTPSIATTSTSTATTTVLQEAIVNHNAGGLSFETKECVSVGDGAYYCSEKEKAAASFTDGVFAAPDIDGDLEIFVRKEGQEVQLTSNTVDDSAPYYDARSERIVWHRQVHERFQIVSYDMNTNEEVLLTDTLYNNMEPVAYESTTLWQAWIQNNWEIMHFDGTQVVQLTNNVYHDVSPHMRDGYIVWQTQFADGWQVSVYDQETKQVEYIPSESGLKVENPRFVLVYDSTDTNGDTQTLGFDLDTKQVMTLGSLPASLPEELPEPDQTGETRALIQNKQSTKDGEQEVFESIHTNQQTGTTTEEHTLDLTSASSTSVGTSTLVIAPEDLIVLPYSTTTTGLETVIHEVVIPPYTSTSTQEVR